jgi:hypothetical protein
MRHVPLLALLALAACGSEEDLGGELPPLVPASLESVGDMEALDLADMPTSGSARFEGEMETTWGADDELTADLDMSVDFGRFSIAGTADNFVSREAGELQGTAAVAGAVVGSGMDATLVGEVGGPDPATGESFAASLDLDLDGDFVADDPANGPQGARGEVTGTMEVLGGATSEATDGSFTVVRTE